MSFVQCSICDNKTASEFLCSSCMANKTTIEQYTDAVTNLQGDMIAMENSTYHHVAEIRRLQDKLEFSERWQLGPLPRIVMCIGLGIFLVGWFMQYRELQWYKCGPAYQFPSTPTPVE